MTIPLVIMRGGTSKALFFMEADLPQELAERDRLILTTLTRSDLKETYGMGTDSLSSKVAVISPSDRPDADVNYFFVQGDLVRQRVDSSVTCGNILSAVGPFAVEAGLVRSTGPETIIRVYSVNTQSISHVIVQTSKGQPVYDGDVWIDGVAESGAPVLINYLNPAGAKTGKLLPTGFALDQFEGVAVSCVDAAVPVVIAQAGDFGKTGYETPKELTEDRELLSFIERVRITAGSKMGLGEVKNSVMPKFDLIAPPRHGGNITSRYFTPFAAHSSHPVTGALCLAAACHIPGSLPAQIAQLTLNRENRIVIEHPAGKIETEIDLQKIGDRVEISKAAFVRTARLLYRGTAHA